MIGQQKLQKLQEAGEAPKSIFIKKVLYFIADIGLNLVILILLVYVIRTYFMTPFRVYGPSMCDTINHIDGKCSYEFGEYLIVDKFSYQNFFGWQVGLPGRGDIIVFTPPLEGANGEDSYIKRIIGLPGEKIVLKDGDVYIYNQEHPKGFLLEEPYLNAQNEHNTLKQQYDIEEFEVPEGKYFVMGDNRVASTDSRSCFKRRFSDACLDNSEYLSIDHIQGKAWVTLWPPSKIRFIGGAEYEKNDTSEESASPKL